MFAQDFIDIQIQQHYFSHLCAKTEEERGSLSLCVLLPCHSVKYVLLPNTLHVKVLLGWS